MHKVLVVIDMQNDFLTGSLKNNEHERVTKEVVNVINNDKYDEVFLTRDTHDDKYLNSQEGKRLPVVHTQINEWGWQIEDSVMSAINNNFDNTNVHFINKPTFGSKDLQSIFEKLEKKYASEGLQIDFCGVCNGICVISNAIPAKMFAPEANIRVLEKACACVTPDSHKSAIEAMKTCQIDIV